MVVLIDASGEGAEQVCIHLSLRAMLAAVEPDARPERPTRIFCDLLQAADRAAAINDARSRVAIIKRSGLSSREGPGHQTPADRAAIDFWLKRSGAIAAIIGALAMAAHQFHL